MYRRPAEWHKHKTYWLGWPWDASLWCENLVAAQAEFIALVKAMLRERVVVVVPNQQEHDVVTHKLGGSFAAEHSCVILPFGDIWLRDTFPIFVRNDSGNVAAVLPTFNGWGEKYLFADDVDLSTRAANLMGAPSTRSPLVFEGGAIESDGAGTLLTTEQCLLNKNRNPYLSKSDVEHELSRLFAAKKIIWLKDGMINDHTDGHIDTIARFIAPATVAIMVPTGKDDPNYDVFMAIKNMLARETDANGDKINLLELPSPGAVLNSDGELMPASYLNFIIGDETVVVPTYGAANDDAAVRIIESFVDVPVIGLSAKAILSGGGAFHCLSQEVYR